MARHVYYSFHYDSDHARVAPILRSHALLAQVEASPSDWVKLRRSGDFAIKRWLESQFKGRSCLIVLIGAETANRPWVQYEIRQAHALGLGLLGVHVHQLKDKQGWPSAKGANPFEHPATELGSYAASIPVFEPDETDSKPAYRQIVDHLRRWSEQAVTLANASRVSATH